MATKTPKQAARKTSRTRAPRAAHAKPARARKPAAPATGPRSNGAFASMTREFKEGYPKSRERKDLYPYTLSGEPIRPLYGPEDLAGMDLARDLAVPGEYPFTRGIHPTMYRGRMFTMRQFAGFGTA